MTQATQQCASQGDTLFLSEIRRAIREEVTKALTKSDQPEAAHERLLRLAEVVKHRTGLGATSVYETPELRACMVKLGRNSFWPSSKVQEFIESVKAKGGVQ